MATKPSNWRICNSFLLSGCASTFRTFPCPEHGQSNRQPFWAAWVPEPREHGNSWKHCKLQAAHVQDEDAASPRVVWRAKLENYGDRLEESTITWAVGHGLWPGQVLAHWHHEIGNTQSGQFRPNRAGLGHYTQIVWRKTSSVVA